MINKTNKTLNYWRKRVFTTLWISFGAFYLCRVNLSIALPEIMKEFGYSRTDVGMIGTVFFAIYAIGQFINGQLGDKFGARRLITIGIFFSVVMNIIFGFVSALAFMIIIWGLNGYFQSMGWPPSIKTLANWFPSENRGRISGLYGTSYQVGNLVSWLLGGYLLLHYGWRYVFWVPATIFAIVGINFYIRIRNSPEDVGFAPVEEKSEKHSGFVFTLKQSIGNPKIWHVGISQFCLNILRYGFIFWIPTYMHEVQGVVVSTAAFKSIILPLTGIFGVLSAGWMADRFFKSKKPLLVTIMLFLLGLFTLLYQRIPADLSTISILCLGIIGFLTMGSNIIMVATMAMDYGTKKAASSAAGFIDSLGYLGSTLTTVASGWLIDNYGWNAVFYFWSISVFIGAIVISKLLRKRTHYSAG